MRVLTSMNLNMGYFMPTLRSYHCLQSDNAVLHRVIDVINGMINIEALTISNMSTIDSDIRANLDNAKTRYAL